MGRLWGAVLTGGILVGVTTMACANTSATPVHPHSKTTVVARPSFTAKRDVHHPLVGKTWQVATGKFVDDSVLLAATHTAHFVLLGESHNAPDHHMLQAWVLRSLFVSGRLPAVAMEQLDQAVQGELDAARKLAPKNPEAIAKAARWEKSGWPPFVEYLPIVQAALDWDAPLIAANLSRSHARELVRKGEGSWPLAERSRLGLSEPLPVELAESLQAELAASHCGMKMPTGMLAGMAFAERARDATMVDRMLATNAPGGVVLIAGTGHTRKDRGVPWLLRQRKRSEVTVSVAFVEVDHASLDPASYAARWNVGSLPFDFVLFTPRVTDEDPCTAIRGK